MNFGKVIMLQGISSAGKSMLATALQMSLDEYWWALEADDITRMQPISDRTNWWRPTCEERPHPSWVPDVQLSHWLAGYFQCLAAIAKTGSNVIAVGGWLQTDWLLQLAAALEGIDAYCVGVYCPLDEAERRELARGDREPGYARSQFDLVHTHAPYDATVDTAALTTAEAVQVVTHILSAPPTLLFFDRVRNRQPCAAQE